VQVCFRTSKVRVPVAPSATPGSGAGRSPDSRSSATEYVVADAVMKILAL
jgi:hypothetical protein